MITTWLKHRNEIFVLIALSLLIILLRLPSIVQPFNNDSAANAYHARLILQGEPLYSTHHSAHHLPAVYYVYAFFFWVLGDSMAAIKIGLIGWQVVTVWVLYAFGKFLHSDRLAILATLFYIILTSDIYMFGMTAEIELFANLPRIASIFVLLYLRHKQAPAWQYSLVGLLGVICFWFKAVYLSTFILVAIIELETKPFRLTQTIQRISWVACGIFIGVIPVVGYFAFMGLLPSLAQVFTLGQNYVKLRLCNDRVGLEQSILPIWLFYPAIGFSNYNIMLFILSLCGPLMLIKKRNNLMLLKYVAYWYLLSYIEVLPPRVYRAYYFLLIVPPLVLVASWFLLDLYHSIRPFSKKIASGLLSGLTFWIIFIAVNHNFNYYIHYVYYSLGRESFETFITDGFDQPGHLILETKNIAEYIHNHTQPQDYIYYWSDEVQLYYMADRLSPTKIIWTCYIGAIDPPQQIFIPQTKYIVVDPAYQANNLPGWFTEELNQSYTLETTVDKQKIYRRTSP